MKSLLIITIIAVAMIGTIIVQEVHASEEVMEDVTPLTINSFEVYEDADYTRYRSGRAHAACVGVGRVQITGFPFPSRTRTVSYCTRVPEYPVLNILYNIILY